MSTGFTEIAKENLLKAGWNQQRSVNVSTYKTLYNSNNYNHVDCVIKFLENFGGLKVQFKHHSVSDAHDFFMINANEVIKDGRLFTSEYENIIGFELFPIGQIFTGHMLLVMSSECKFYAIFEDIALFLGNNVHEFVNNVSSSQNILHIENSPSDFRGSGEIPALNHPGMSRKISEVTLLALERSGWKIDRSTKINSIKHLYVKNNIYLSPAASNFLDNFGGMVLSLPNRSDGQSSHCHFTAEKIEVFLVDSNIKFYGDIIQSAVCVIGYMDEAKMYILVSEQGSFFGVLELLNEFVLYAGSNENEFLNRICEGGDWERFS